MIHPHTALHFINEDVGYGVRATRPIPCGTVTWVMDRLDQTFTPSAVARMRPVERDTLEHYSYRNHRGHYVFCWDHARYMNHSFLPNCVATAYACELAVRDIEAGEELLNDYGFLNIREPFRPRDEGTRRKVVYPDDLKRHHSHWDDLLKPAFAQLQRVEQHLQPAFSPARWRQVMRVAQGKTPMKSILNNLLS
ncbi:MAG TPA: SET domain-containing protein-lysine N-methyltransferase [Verrucomicrobia bacterium]|nr:SET domain-containing protein-lysine N-methyltransferase [Verrucomicrobiota bacterium]